jgi:hypothetical protein
MVKNILGKIKVDGNWVAVDMGTFNDCYMIAIKEEMGKKDTINPIDVTSINFEIGIDSGIKNSPISISRFSINFNEVTSRDKTINKITGFTKLLNIPSNFYLRVVSINTKTSYNGLTEGQTSIVLNINPLDLG